MKLSQFAAAALGASALALLAGTAKAADQVVFAGAGSSAQWKIFEQSAESQFPNHYAAHNGGIVHDAANPSHVEKGDIWVCWDNNTPANVAYFVKVDSTVGVRAYFNSDTGSFTSPILPPDNTGYNPSGDVTPPSDVIAAVNGSTTSNPGSPINVGLTDITPADAQVATARSLALGYNVNHPITSDFDTSNASPVPFNIGARSFNLVPLGAAPVIVFVNVSDTAAGGFGSIPTDPSANPSYEFRNNIDRFTLSGFLSGQFGRTRQLNSDPTLFNGSGTGTVAAKSVTTLVREPLSGTYNTMEYCVPESAEASPFTSGLGQEDNFPSSVTHVSGAGGIRRRVIGTSQSVLQGNTIANSLGYAFGAIANFKGDTNLRYLTVDGADPLYNSYSDSQGSLQGVTPLTFRNIKNGGYPIWSVLRAVTQSPTPAAISTIISNLAPTDFVKFTDLEVFRSYHDTPGSVASGAASNGHIYLGGGAFDQPVGGDVGGAVFPINADYDFINDAGAELTNLFQ